MKKLSFKECTEMNAINKLYDYLDLDARGWRDDMKRGYLTAHTGRDGNEYYWYFDGVHDACVREDNCKIIADSGEIEFLFFL